MVMVKLLFSLSYRRVWAGDGDSGEALLSCHTVVRVCEGSLIVIVNQVVITVITVLME